MKMMNRFKGIIIVALVFSLMVCQTIIPTQAKAANFSSQIGTNKALGSPLLNENFTYENWNKWEMVVFGIFLSNFVVPLVDSYETAFTSTSQGSAGRGKKALDFGGGSDSQANRALMPLLEYAITNQKNSYRNIRAVKIEINDNGETIRTNETIQATIEHLLISSVNNSSGQPFVSYDSSKDISIDGYKVQVPHRAVLYEFVVDGSTYGQNEVVFSWLNSWDVQIMQAWLAGIVTGEFADKASNNLEKMMAAKSNLVLDNFGNICAILEGDMIIIVPAATNCHLYNNTKYNLLNSVVISDRYTNASVDNLVKSARVNKSIFNLSNSAGSPLAENGGLKQGEVVVYFDTDYGIYDYVKNSLSEVKGSIVPILTSRNLGSENLNWGQRVLALINSTLTADASYNSLGIKIEIVGGKALGNEGIIFKTPNSAVAKMAQDFYKAIKLLSSVSQTNTRSQILNKIVTPWGEAEFFGSAAYVSINSDIDENAENTLTRYLVNSAFQYLDGTKKESSGLIGMEAPIALKSNLASKGTFKDVAEWLWYENGKENKNISKFMKNTINGEGEKLFTRPDNGSLLSVLADNNLTYKKLDDAGVELESGGIIPLYRIAERDSVMSVTAQRVLKIYTRNSAMQNAINILGVKEGSEFAVWTPCLYVTYLDWFGLLDGTIDINRHLFNETSDMLNLKPEETFKGTFLTKEEKEEEVLNYTYMMLHPTVGAEYRIGLMTGWMADYMYKTYRDIVYGKGIVSYTGDNGTVGSTGFLNISSYSDNFVTSWFIQNYSKYTIVLVGILLIGLIVIGVIKRKTISWFLLSLIIMINVVLILPALGEITPYVANNVVQKIFNGKMNYWAMAESIANAKIEKQMVIDDGSNGSLNVNDYIRILNVAYLDRSIMLKGDISKKITEDSAEVIAEIQRLNSTRWLLPTLIRQYSSNDGSANYVYQALGDVYDNVSNMYWLYNPDDRTNVITANSVSTEVDTEQLQELDVYTKKLLYDGYKETSMDATKANFDIEDSGDYMGYTWNSVSRVNDDENVTHAGFYLLPGINVVNARGNWDEVAMNPGVNIESYLKVEGYLEYIASRYEPRSKGALPEYGYLWTTESLAHYFYQVVKDTFKHGRTIAMLSGDLQGFYKVNEKTGKEERNSFMHYRDTGYIRDLADMQELFTNLMPYMYTVQLIAGGTNGDNGLFGDNLITNYELYKNMNKSWLFRCNWVTKLMEDKELTRDTTVRNLKGERVRIENPMLPSSYPENRPMIFSEAEMIERGYRESELTVPEMKIIKVNEAIERQWTLLLNYVNTPDITTEVFYRQMGMIALFEFNKEFSPDRAINGTRALYPNAFDLRNISFDSVMKMLMINSTRNANYIYGDTMKQVINNSDIFTATLLLIAAFFSAYIIPFLREFVMGILLYLCIWSLITNLLAPEISKLKISTAFVLNNIVYLGITIMYYLVFGVLINTSTADSVLSIGNIAIDAGPPTWQFFIIIITSVVYIYISYRLIKFTLINFKDMGFEAYASWTGHLSDKISNVIGGMKIGESVTGFKSEEVNINNSNTVRDDGTTNIVSNININNDSSKDLKLEEVSNKYSNVRENDVAQEIQLGNENEFDTEIKRGKELLEKEAR